MTLDFTDEEQLAAELKRTANSDSRTKTIPSDQTHPAASRLGDAGVVIGEFVVIAAAVRTVVQSLF